MDVNFISSLWHEIFGIIISVLITIHLILNFKWVKNITKNIKKVKKQIKALYVVDMLTFFSYFTTIFMGILISTNIFVLKTRYNPYLMLIHHIMGRISLMFMLIHLGFHLDKVILKFTKNKNVKILIYVIYVILSLFIMMYLVYKLVNNYVWQGFFGDKR